MGKWNNKVGVTIPIKMRGVKTVMRSNPIFQHNPAINDELTDEVTLCKPLLQLFHGRK